MQILKKEGQVIRIRHRVSCTETEQTPQATLSKGVCNRIDVNRYVSIAKTVKHHRRLCVIGVFGRDRAALQKVGDALRKMPLRRLDAIHRCIGVFDANKGRGCKIIGQGCFFGVDQRDVFIQKVYVTAV